MTFAESERLTPDEARQFIRDLTMNMTNRAHRLARLTDEVDDYDNRDDEEMSIQKEVYGDSWTFLYGIVQGMDKMKKGSSRNIEADGMDIVDNGWDVDDRKWQEHYDEFGSGLYGRGLEIGKKLAFYTDKSFDFSVSTDKSDQSLEDKKFTLTDYSDE